jgi:hypothetical protein
VDVLHLHFTIIAGLLALISAAILVIVSLVTRPPSGLQVAQFTFHSAGAAPLEGLRWWQDYRLHSALLIILASALVIAHW